MQVYICLRETLDWENEAAVDAGLVDRFRPQVETWNGTFNIPYHQFRHRLKVIAQRNLSRVEGVRCVRLEELPPDGLVVPVDDDDWFSPEVANRLREAFDPSIQAYYWTRHILEPERKLRAFKGWLRELITGEIIFATNNYAVSNVPDFARFVRAHLVASEYFQAHPRQRRYLRAALSLHNRNLASQTVLGMGKLRPPIPREQLIERFGEYRTLYARTRLPRALRWAEPYMAMMAELMDDLKLR